jgi:hypothetical protein
MREESIRKLNELWKKEFGRPFNYAFNHIIDWSLTERGDGSIRMYICRVTVPANPMIIGKLAREECETIMQLLRQIINDDHTA